MSVLIRVKDYNILKDSSIEVKGLTAILGESANGKSSFYNAVRTLVHNTVGNYYIRAGATSTTIAINFPDAEDKRSVVFQKADSPMYKLGKEVYQKIGRIVPEDIETFLNMAPIDVEGTKFSLNFIDQMQPPILKNLSGTQLYSLTIKSFEGEKINAAVKKAKADKDAINEKITLKALGVDSQRILINNLGKKLAHYAEYLKIKDKVPAYRIAVSQKTVVDSYISAYSVLLTGVRTLKANNKGIVDNAWIFIEWNAVKHKKSSLQILDSWNTQKVHVDSQVLESQAKCDQFENIPTVQEVASHKSNLEVYTSLKETLDILSSMTEANKVLTTAVDYLTTALTDTYPIYLENRNQLAVLLTFADDYNRVDIRYTNLLSALELLNEVGGDNYLTYQSDLHMLKSVKEFLAESSVLELDILSCEENLENFNVADLILDALPSYGTAKSKLESALEFVEKVKAITDLDSVLQDNIKDTESQINEIEARQKTGACPCCGNNIKHLTPEIMATFVEKLETLNSKREQYKGQLTQLGVSRDQLFKKIKESGYDPETLEAEAQRLATEIKTFEDKATPIVEKLYAEVEKGNL